MPIKTYYNIFSKKHSPWFTYTIKPYVLNYIIPFIIIKHIIGITTMKRI